MRNILLRPLALLLTLFIAHGAQATTIQQFTFDELAADAGFIFQGRVIDLRSDEEADGLVYTWVRFEVDEVLKGEARGRLLELRFLGGETLGARLEVAGMHLPREGETGIYFIESLDRNLINPLLGWSQGHFLVQRGADGEAVVTDANGQDPAARLAAPADPLADKAANLKQGRSAAVSETRDQGMNTNRAATAITQGAERGAVRNQAASTVTAEDFKQALRAALERAGR